MKELIKKARQVQVSIFCIGYSQIEKRYLGNLEQIAERTGGVFADAPQFREMVELFKAARDLKGNEKSRPHPAAS